MAHQTTVRNPFMLMLNPEVVLAAVESSERLSRLNRHMCRPLDRPLLTGAQPAAGAEVEVEVEVEVEDDDDTIDVESADGTEGAAQ